MFGAAKNNMGDALPPFVSGEKKGPFFIENPKDLEVCRGTVEAAAEGRDWPDGGEEHYLMNTMSGTAMPLNDGQNWMILVSAFMPGVMGNLGAAQSGQEGADVLSPAYHCAAVKALGLDAADAPGVIGETPPWVPMQERSPTGFIIALDKYTWALLSDEGVRHEFCFDGSGGLAFIYMRRYEQPTAQTRAATAIAQWQVDRFVESMGSTAAVIANWKASCNLMRTNANTIDKVLEATKDEGLKQGLIKQD